MRYGSLTVSRPLLACLMPPIRQSKPALDVAPAPTRHRRTEPVQRACVAAQHGHDLVCVVDGDGRPDAAIRARESRHIAPARSQRVTTHTSASERYPKSARHELRQVARRS